MTRCPAKHAPEPKFPAGSRVERIGPDCGPCKSGEEYTVKEPADYCDQIALVEVDGRFSAKHFARVIDCGGGCTGEYCAGCPECEPE